MNSKMQVRIKNITFYMNESLDIYEPNRNFLRLVNDISDNINLKKYLVNGDYENIIKSIKNKQNYFVTEIKARGEEHEVILFFEYVGELIKVDMLLLNNLYDEYKDLNVKVNEYESFLTFLNYHYWIYDISSDLLIFKSTRDLGLLFQGTLEQGIDYIKNYFNIFDEDDRVNNILLHNIKNSFCFQLYKYKTKNDISIALRTKEFYLGDKKYFVGFYMLENENILNEEYVEKRDELTNLYNKKTISDIAKNLINSHIEFSLAVIDIDRFKHFNDTFGHAFGDKVIVKIANVLKDAVKGVGYAGRIGGDEFMCVIERTDEESLRNVVRDIKLGVQWSLNASTTDSVVTCSIGIARYPLNVADYKQMFELADKCLYIAKNKGRNCYIIYKPEMHDEIIKSNNEAKKAESINKKFYNNVKEQYNILISAENKASNLLELLAKYLGVDKITIYDSNYNMVKVYGDNSIEPRRDFIKKDNYFKYFNSFGYFLMDNTAILDTLDKEKYDMYLKDDIFAALEVLRRDNKGNVLGLICFDKFKPAKTFNEDKVKFVLFICGLI